MSNRYSLRYQDMARKAADYDRMHSLDAPERDRALLAALSPETRAAIERCALFAAGAAALRDAAAEHAGHSDARAVLALLGEST